MSRSPNGAWRIGVDTGGTFTDLVAVGPGGEVRLQKVASTPVEPARATFDALKRSQVDPRGEVDSFIMGTTIATNALIQRRGAPTVLITTAGFEDVLYIQRIDRQGLYDLQWVKAEPYVPRDRVVGVNERILADGSVRTGLAWLDGAVERGFQLPVAGEVQDAGSAHAAFGVEFQVEGVAAEQA